MHNILVITYWSYNDALIQTYTLPYLRIIRKYLPPGSTLFLLTLEKEKEIKIQAEDEGIKIVSLPYLPFGAGAFFLWMRALIKLWALIQKQDIKTLHAWCTPGGMIGYILSVLSRKELVIDSYEPHAEAMVENGSWKKNSFAFRLLFYFEMLQTRRAKHLIAANGGMRQYAKEKYGYEGTNFFVKPACTDLELFSSDKRKNEQVLESLNLKNKITCIYAGKFGGIYLEKEAFDFFAEAWRFWNEKFCVLLLTSHRKEEIQEWCRQSGVPFDIFRVYFVPHQQVAGYMGAADFAITPVKPVPTKRFCSPIKDGEYWAMGLPVVIPAHISDDSDMIEKENAGAVLQSFSVAEYRQALRKIDRLLQEDRPGRDARIRRIAERSRNFSIAEDIYSRIYGKR